MRVTAAGRGAAPPLESQEKMPAFLVTCRYLSYLFKVEIKIRVEKRFCSLINVDGEGEEQLWSLLVSRRLGVTSPHRDLALSRCH